MTHLMLAQNPSAGSMFSRSMNENEKVARQYDEGTDLAISHF